MKNKNLITYALFLLLTITALFVVKIFNISYPLTITTTQKTTELAMVGVGRVEVVPDTAYIDVGISVNNASSVVEVEKTINKTNNTIIEAMKKIKISKNNIKTTNYSIYPNYNYENNQNKISGYNGNVAVSIRVKDPQLASKVIQEATNAGANQINGTRFIIEKPEDYQVRAREVAIKNAKEQAQKLASSLGIKLGKITNIIESSPDSSGILKTSMMLGERGGGMGGGADFEQGTQEITSTVTLYFEKK